MKSIWTDNSTLSEFPKLDHDISTDVLIIGGGMAGILTAYLLKQKNIKCILVEQNRICNGVTGNTTAKITYQHGLIYHKILKSYGIEKAEMYLNAGISAFNKYAELCKNCDYGSQDNRRIDGIFLHIQ